MSKKQDGFLYRRHKLNSKLAIVSAMILVAIISSFVTQVLVRRDEYMKCQEKYSLSLGGGPCDKIFDIDQESNGIING